MGNAKWLEQRTDSLLDGRENERNLPISGKKAYNWKTSPKGIRSHIQRTENVCQTILCKIKNDLGQFTSEQVLKECELVAHDIKTIHHKLSEYLPGWECSSESISVEIRNGLLNNKRLYSDLKMSCIRATDN
jgi:hypothetical protein